MDRPPNAGPGMVHTNQPDDDNRANSRPSEDGDSSYEAGVLAGANIFKRSFYKHSLIIAVLALIFWVVIPGILIGVGGILICMYAVPGGRSMRGNSSLGHCDSTGAYEMATVYTLVNFAVGTMGGVLAKTLLERLTRKARSARETLRIFVQGGKISAREHRSKLIKEEYERRRRNKIDRAEGLVRQGQSFVDQERSLWRRHVYEDDLAHRTTSLHPTSQNRNFRRDVNTPLPTDPPAVHIAPGSSTRPEPLPYPNNDTPPPTRAGVSVSPEINIIPEESSPHVDPASTIPPSNPTREVPDAPQPPASDVARTLSITSSHRHPSVRTPQRVSSRRHDRSGGFDNHFSVPEIPEINNNAHSSHSDHQPLARHSSLRPPEVRSRNLPKRSASVGASAGSSAGASRAALVPSNQEPSDQPSESRQENSASPPPSRADFELRPTDPS